MIGSQIKRAVKRPLEGEGSIPSATTKALQEALLQEDLSNKRLKNTMEAAKARQAHAEATATEAQVGSMLQGVAPDVPVTDSVGADPGQATATPPVEYAGSMLQGLTSNLAASAPGINAPTASPTQAQDPLVASQVSTQQAPSPSVSNVDTVQASSTQNANETSDTIVQGIKTDLLKKFKEVFLSPDGQTKAPGTLSPEFLKTYEEKLTQVLNEKPDPIGFFDVLLSILTQGLSLLPRQIKAANRRAYISQLLKIGESVAKQQGMAQDTLSAGIQSLDNLLNLSTAEEKRKGALEAILLQQGFEQAKENRRATQDQKKLAETIRHNKATEGISLLSAQGKAGKGQADPETSMGYRLAVADSQNLIPADDRVSLEQAQQDPEMMIRLQGQQLAVKGMATGYAGGLLTGRQNDLAKERLKQVEADFVRKLPKDPVAARKHVDTALAEINKLRDAYEKVKNDRSVFLDQQGLSTLTPKARNGYTAFQKGVPIVLDTLTADLMAMKSGISAEVKKKEDKTFVEKVYKSNSDASFAKMLDRFSQTIGPIGRGALGLTQGSPIDTTNVFTGKPLIAKALGVKNKKQLRTLIFKFNRLAKQKGKNAALKALLERVRKK